MSLEGAEDEEFVLQDRGAHRATHEVLVEGADRDMFSADALLEKVIRIQKGVAIGVESIAMDRVGSGLQGRAYNATGVAVVFRVQRTIDQVELGDRIQDGNYHLGVEGDVIGVGTVDQVRRLLLLSAAD